MAVVAENLKNLKKKGLSKQSGTQPSAKSSNTDANIQQTGTQQTGIEQTGSSKVVARGKSAAASTTAKSTQSKTRSKSRSSSKPAKAKAVESKVSTAVKTTDNIDPLHAKPKRNPLVWIVSVIVIAIIIYGWVVSEDSYITPEEGIGYWLGIIGGMAMILLLTYPLRKKWRVMRKMGGVRYWFKVHMFLGLLGPVLVLFHANFSLGSVNSSIAFFSMLLVAASGVVGKYFYLKIHYGLYGKHATMGELKDDLQLTKGMLGKYISLSEQMKERLLKYEKSVTEKQGFIIALFRLPLTYVHSRWMLYSVLYEIKIGITKYADEKGWDKKLRNKLYNRSKNDISTYIFHVKKIAEFTIYEQLFALWHILHYPLFFALIVTGIVHVFAVHIF